MSLIVLISPLFSGVFSVMMALECQKRITFFKKKGIEDIIHNESEQEYFDIESSDDSDFTDEREQDSNFELFHCEKCKYVCLRSL